MNIIVLGDIMLDINYDSIVTRNAPEANIPIYNIINTNYVLGGSANVANNLKNLDTNVELIGLIGNDRFGIIIKNILDSKKITHKLFMDNRNTIQKTRIFLNNKLNVRFDIEDIYDISDIIENEVIYYVTNKPKIDAIIISDYDKGFITQHLCETIIKYANENNIPTFVDPKIKNYLKYKDCFLFKPNINEAEQLTNHKDLDIIINLIKININCKNLLITRGKDGMILNCVRNKIEHDCEINLLDVTGAGDVCLSVLVYCFLKYGDLLESCKISNYVSGKSVSVIGNYSISLNDIKEYIDKKKINTDINKIIYDYEEDKLKQFQGKNVVFTNGCFDIVHSAHLKLLNFCKTQGEILIVGLNSNESIKKIKGEKRPINDISERCDFLLNLNVVDYVVVFNDDTPYNIINLIKPKTLVKGGDYNHHTIIGAELVENVLIYEYIKNKSSTLIINKIMKN